MTRGRKWAFGCVTVLVAVMLVGGAVEVGLRLQARIRPFVDLELLWLDRPPKYLPSETVNHAPRPRVEKVVRGTPTVMRWDDRGIRSNSLRPSVADSCSVKVLFTGDSFMQGFPEDRHTIPQQVWTHLEAWGDLPEGTCLLNAGFTSYSPLVFIAQMRRLLPMIRPQIVVVEIDETDLMDDTIRYRDLARRDETGHVVGVRSGRTAYEDESRARHRWIRESPLYAVRGLRRMWVRGRYLPAYAERHPERSPVYESLLAPSLAPRAEAAARFAEELDFFRTNLAELAGFLAGELGGESVLFSHHPHYLHLFAAGGERYNRVVVETMLETCAEYGVQCYDTSEDVRKQIESAPDERYYRWPEDRFSHFTREGMGRYAELIAKRLAPMLRRRPAADPAVWP